MEVVVATGATRRANLQSNHHQQTKTQLFTGWMPFLSPNQQCQCTKEKSGDSLTVNIFHTSRLATWGTGIRGLMRGMATLPQGNQELLVVKDKVGRPPVSLESMECDTFP